MTKRKTKAMAKKMTISRMETTTALGVNALYFEKASRNRRVR
jgi:hypothetical protein